MTTDDQNNKKRPVSKRTVPSKPPGPLADWQEHPQVSPETYQKLVQRFPHMAKTTRRKQ